MTLLGNSKLVDSRIDYPFAHPLDMLEQWLNEAERVGVSEPRGFVLSTVNKFEQPSSRVVLLKEFDNQGIIFSINEKSPKGIDLKYNSYVAGTLWWHEIIQQINFRGKAIKLSKNRSDILWNSRAREAQAVASISEQSAVLINEKALRENVSKMLKKQDKIKRPPSWHAYHIIIDSIEFWIGSKDRFHRRLQYNLRG